MPALRGQGLGNCAFWPATWCRDCGVSLRTTGCTRPPHSLPDHAKWNWIPGTIMVMGRIKSLQFYLEQAIALRSRLRENGHPTGILILTVYREKQAASHPHPSCTHTLPEEAQSACTYPEKKIYKCHIGGASVFYSNQSLASGIMYMIYDPFVSVYFFSVQLSCCNPSINSI